MDDDKQIKAIVAAILAVPLVDRALISGDDLRLASRIRELWYAIYNEIEHTWDDLPVRRV